eukprot:TRINITY_DN36212_c0_g1_i1.p1 TRINITY_DN36212_c0_g1~~TRINITY_DN36212_c0_g1_i1.p1  ORF type:complete len:318 (+),score=107.30 TRINITY_DN36212_c0_g1_i1:106-954(+)
MGVSADHQEAPPAVEVAPMSLRVVSDLKQLARAYARSPRLRMEKPPAGREGQHCTVQEVCDDGLIVVRFSDDDTALMPKQAIAGYGFELDDDSESDLGICDVCGHVCIPDDEVLTAGRRRVCGDVDTVYALYQSFFSRGLLPPWNPRDVPNPRRAFCCGAEADVLETDPVSEKVKLRFGDHFVCWFPSQVLQGEGSRRTEAGRAVDMDRCVPDISALFGKPPAAITLPEWDQRRKPEGTTLSQRAGFDKDTRDTPFAKFLFGQEEDQWSELAMRAVLGGAAT